MLMQKLRKNIKYVLIVALVGFLALIFFQWGANITGAGRGQETNIAKIDGIPVSYTEYSRFIRLKEQEQKVISRDDVWNLMVEEVMWNNLVKREKMRVTDEEVLAVIRNNPPREIYESEYMQNENGEFDINKYYELLRAPQSRAWLLEYEFNLRRQLPREKIRSLISSFGWVSPYEDSVTIAKQNVAYDITYLGMPFFRARALVKIAEEEMRKYYDSNRDEFMSPESKILKFVFFERKPSHYDTMEAKEDIEDFIARIEEGEDFLEVAEEVTDDTVVVVSFEGEAGLKPYLMNVYKVLKNGEMSDIIQASRGFEVIKRVRKGLIHKMRANIEVSEMTKGEIYDKIMSFKEAVQEAGFDYVAVDFDIPVRKTYPLSSDNVAFPVRDTEGLAKFVRTATRGEIGGPFGSLGGYYLFTLDSIIPATQPAFEEIVPTIKARMEKEKLGELVEHQFTIYYDQLMAGKTMDEIAAEDTLVLLRSSEGIALGQIQMTLGNEFAGVVATLEPNQMSTPLIMDWAGYIIRCDAKVVNPFDSTMITPLQMMRQARLQELTLNIFTPKKLEDNRDLFFE